MTAARTDWVGVASLRFVGRPAERPTERMGYTPVSLVGDLGAGFFFVTQKYVHFLCLLFIEGKFGLSGRVENKPIQDS